jgi:hypothetical protein
MQHVMKIAHEDFHACVLLVFEWYDFRDKMGRANKDKLPCTLSHA